jgi:hypothetical protein
MQMVDVQNEYDYIKYLRLSDNKHCSSVTCSAESQGFSDSACAVDSLVVSEAGNEIKNDNFEEQVPPNNILQDTTVTIGLCSGLHSAVKSLKPVLPVLEDGLSSGHASDADDAEDCNETMVVGQNLHGDGNHELGQLSEQGISSEPHKQGEVEKAIHEIRLAIQKSRSQAMVQPPYEDVTLSNKESTQQPVWITRLVLTQFFFKSSLASCVPIHSLHS